MLTLPLWLSLVAAAPSPAPAHNSAEPQLEQQKEEFAVALLATRGVDQEALVGALGMRMPDLKLRTTWKAGDVEGNSGTLFVDIHRAPAIDGVEAEEVGVDVVLSDGRAFRRSLRAGHDDTRIIASFLTNLLLSIEERTVVADKEGVPIPETSEAVDVAAVVEKLDAQEPEAPEVSEEQSPPEDPPAPTESPKTPAPDWRPWQLGPRVSGSFAFAAGAPAFADTLAGGGGSVGLDARKDNGLLLDFDLRFAGEQKELASLLRIRASFGAGYELRRGPFAFPATLAYTLETYRLDFADAAVSPLDLEAPSLLNGLRIRVTPSYRLELERGPLRALRLGLRGEVAGSFGLDSGARVLGFRLGESATGADELFRLGGLELSFGLELGADFGLRKSEATP